jgi:hypothetical protein
LHFEVVISKSQKEKFMNFNKLVVTVFFCVSFHANAGSSDRNFYIPLVQCKVSAETLAKVTENKSHINEELSVVVDFEDMMLNYKEAVNVEGIVAYSMKQVGGVDSSNEFGVGSILNGTVVIDKEKKQIVFTSKPVKYSTGYIWKKVLTLTSTDGHAIKGELVTINTARNDNVASDTDLYNCVQQSDLNPNFNDFFKSK